MLRNYLFTARNKCEIQGPMQILEAADVSFHGVLHAGHGEKRVLTTCGHRSPLKRLENSQKLAGCIEITGGFSRKFLTRNWTVDEP